MRQLEYKNIINQVWFLQLSFWLFFCFVSFITLTIWYEQHAWPYIFHTLLQSILGLTLSFSLYWVFMLVWDHSLILRLSINIFFVLIVAFVWTLIRIATFIYMTEEKNVWNDFGGWYFGSIFIFLSWASMFHGIRYYQLLQNEHKIMLRIESGIKDEQLKRMTAQTIARDAQIKMLRYQLNPHFLCNTLNAINSLIELEEPQKAQRMTVQLSKFLRYSLDNNPNTKVSLESELNALNLYLEIEKTRFGDRLKLDFQIGEKAKVGSIPSLLLQPIIENSMKHVIAKNENGGTIHLNASVKDQQLILELSDTGLEVKLDRNKIRNSNRRGVGLRNIDQRLKVLYEGAYKIDLKIISNGALKTTIKIPYEPLTISANNRANRNHRGHIL
ncbi:MAG: two-component system LytT family sensor kinase [Polaribacter sp.]|jgi:two-component system LytT family sensor kinase